MNNITKKSALFYGLFLFLCPYCLSTSELLRQYTDGNKQVPYKVVPIRKRGLLVCGYCSKIPLDISSLIVLFVYDDFSKYRGQKMPEDLSNQDLNGFDLTGCRFFHTNLTYTNLANSILTNTTCDYEEAFLENMKKNNHSEWYSNNIVRDLKSIKETYQKLNHNEEKALLLHIASGFSLLGYYKDERYQAKLNYWSCEWLIVKKMLMEEYSCFSSVNLVCSLEDELKRRVQFFCWTSEYSPGQMSMISKESSDLFEGYIAEFENGLNRFKNHSKSGAGKDHYKKRIVAMIQGLENAYQEIHNEKFKKEILYTASSLAKSYQKKKIEFLVYYFFWQNRLIWLKEMTGSNHIYFKCD